MTSRVDSAVAAASLVSVDFAANSKDSCNKCDHAVFCSSARMLNFNIKYILLHFYKIYTVMLHDFILPASFQSWNKSNVGM